MSQDKLTVRFTPYAYAKLCFMRDQTDNEVGGFGISSAFDPLLIEDFIIVKQEVTSVTVKLDDIAVADFFEDMVDRGLRVDQFARIWIHTHPGNSPTPSGVDEETFKRVFGKCDWSMMLVLAKGGSTYARLKYGVGPAAAMNLDVNIAYYHPFPGSDFKAWEEDYKAKVTACREVWGGLGAFKGHGKWENEKGSEKGKDEKGGKAPISNRDKPASREQMVYTLEQFGYSPFELMDCSLQEIEETYDALMESLNVDQDVMPTDTVPTGAFDDADNDIFLYGEVNDGYPPVDYYSEEEMDKMMDKVAVPGVPVTSSAIAISENERAILDPQI